MYWYIEGGYKMDIRACKRCKNLFQHISGRSICPHCLKKEEEMFGRVKDFLRKYPGAEMQEVSMETDVPVHIIESFIRAGRLEVVAQSAMKIPCDKCGTPIRTGRYCNSCAKELQGQLSQVASELESKQNAKQEDGTQKARMRFLNEGR